MNSETSKLRGRTWKIDLVCRGVQVRLELKQVTMKIGFFLQEKYNLTNVDMSLLSHGSAEIKKLLETASTAQIKERMQGLYDFSRMLEANDTKGFYDLCEIVFMFLTEKSKDYLFQIPVEPYRDENGVVHDFKLNAYERLAQLILEDSDISQSLANKMKMIEGICHTLNGSFEAQKKTSVMTLLSRKVRSLFPSRKQLTLSPRNMAGAWNA